MKAEVPIIEVAKFFLFNCPDVYLKCVRVRVSVCVSVCVHLCVCLCIGCQQGLVGFSEVD